MADTIDPATNDEVHMTDQAKSGRARSGARSGVRDTVKTKFTEQKEALRGQARTKARDYAEQGKGKAAETLESISRFFDETAATVDKELGPNIGDYVHRAADAVAGFTDTLKDKDVDELLNEAREAVRRNPALAIGAAAAVGFVLVRLLKSAGSGDETASDAMPPRTGIAPSADELPIDSGT